MNDLNNIPEEFRDNPFFKLVNFMQRFVEQYDDDEKQKTYSIINNSLKKEFFNIDETPLNYTDKSADLTIKLDKYDISTKNSLNMSFYKQIEPIIDFTIFESTYLIKKDDYETKYQSKKILFDVNLVYYAINIFNCETLPQTINFTQNSLINYLINLKIYFFENFFEQLIAIFRTISNKGYNDTPEILKYLITNYENALTPEKKINCFNSFVFDEYGINISKDTSDKYCQKMINIYQEKMKIISFKDSSKGKKTVDNKLTLIDVFADKKLYPTIMDLLVENNYCFEKTYAWKDTDSGYKGMIVYFIKILDVKLYLDRKLTSEEIKVIILNTFGFSISLRQIQNIKVLKDKEVFFSFIPPNLQ